jgi:sugar phosphate isomerase/epimerase
MEHVRVADDGRSFALAQSGRAFVPWGFNYDRDSARRLLEDYWEDEWATVESDFREMKELGANVVRVHLQFGKFMRSPTEPDAASLRRLRELVQLAERTELYLVVTGLGCYRKQDVPAWYDALDEEQRWAAQARFWEAIARTCKDSPAIFGYDLMNEPLSPVFASRSGDWLAPPFADLHYAQWISLDPRGRRAPEIARAWVRELVAAIRRHDRRHLVTVGLLSWSLDGRRLRSGFVPEKIAPDLDFIAVHLYPESGKLDEAMETLQGFAVRKPVLIEETFPLICSLTELGEFVARSRAVAAGHLGFYWGSTPAELRAGTTPHDASMRQWLEYFQTEATRLRAEEARQAP